MRLPVTAWLRSLLQGFWAVPGGVVLFYVVLAFVLLRLDHVSPEVAAAFAFDGDAPAARGVLSSVAGGVISMTSLTLSLTIVTLQLASSQFTPRALKSLLADRFNQVVAGAFVGTVAYALLVLRAVRQETEQDPGFVPALSVTVGIALALLSLVLLLLFVHHIGQVIKVENIAASIGRATLRSADHLFPSPFGRSAPVPEPGDLPGPPAKLFPPRPGYVQDVSMERLCAAAGGHVERVEVLLAPGDFATPASPLLLVWPASLGGRERRRLVRAVSVSSERDLADDVGFGIRQLVDIALRAVSPGVNDPTTAVTCIGYVTAVLECLAGRDFPETDRRCGDHDVPFRFRVVPFEAHLEAGFLEVARSASSDPRVVGALLEGLRRVAEAARTGGALERERAVLDLAADVAARAGAEVSGSDRDRISRLEAELSSGSPPSPRRGDLR